MTEPTQTIDLVELLTHACETDDPSEIIVTYWPDRQPLHRIRFESRDSGGWFLIDEEHTGCKWRTIGREPITRLSATASVAAPTSPGE